MTISCWLSVNFYFASVGLWSIVMSTSVCLPVRMHNAKTMHPNFTKFFVHGACGCGSVVSPYLMSLLYVMYFWFYGWRHVFIPRDLWADRRARRCVPHWHQWTWPGTGRFSTLARRAGLLGSARRLLSGSWSWLLPGTVVHISPCASCYC